MNAQPHALDPSEAFVSSDEQRCQIGAYGAPGFGADVELLSVEERGFESGHEVIGRVRENARCAGSSSREPLSDGECENIRGCCDSEGKSAGRQIRLERVERLGGVYPYEQALYVDHDSQRS